MDYREELRKLKEEQEKFETIKKRTARKWKRFVIGVSGIIPSIAFLLLGMMFDSLEWVVASTVAFVLAIVGGIIIPPATGVYSNEILDWLEKTFADISEASKLNRTEKDRKAKIDFFERLVNDPDFRKAWEDQMRGTK